MNAAANSENESCEEALRNSLVLRNIFKFLPTGFLLSSCGLVNKSWNNESRTFIRDKRNCTVTVREMDENFCHFLKHLDEACGEITENARIVPFNSMVYDLAEGLGCMTDVRGDADDGDELVIPNLRSQLRLLYLDVDCRSDMFHCRAHEPLLLLFHHISNEIRNLKIECVSRLGAATGHTTDWNPHFTDLEIISMSDVPAGDPWSQETWDIVRNMLEQAPHLKTIITQDLETLRFVPKDKYPLLEEIEFKITQPQDVALYEDIIEARPRLRTLRIFPLMSDIGAGGVQLGYNMHANAGHDPQQKFDTTLEKLLQTFHQTLETISIAGAYGLGRLCHPPLINLTKFRVDRVRELRKITEFHATVSSIDYANRMPKLEEVEFEAPCPERWSSNSHTSAVQNPSTTIRKMSLTITTARANMLFFRQLFPQISVLKIMYERMGDYTDVSSILQLWPNVEELTIMGRSQLLRRSFDSEFCGIHPEEAELLRGKDDEYLRAVNIVPTRQSILTMQNLRKLRVELHFLRVPEVDLQPSTPAVKFISKVTEIVALERMRYANVSLSWTVRDYGKHTWNSHRNCPLIN